LDISRETENKTGESFC